MKASLTFREEKSPLIRLKFPVNIAGFSLASGINIGDNEDLCLYAGTPPDACPSVKLAYRPNLPSSSLSLTVKAGLGPWGPPRLAALSASAELRFSRVSSDPFFTLHFKPRLGDFSIRKMVNPVSLNLPADAHEVIGEGCNHSRSSHSHRQSNNSSKYIAHEPQASEDNSHSDIFGDADAANKGMISYGVFDDVDGVTPRQLDKSSLYTPMPFQRAVQKTHTTPAAENQPVDTWGSDYVKIDDFEHRNRRSYDADTARKSLDGGGRPSFDNLNDQSSAESPLSASVGGGSSLNDPETDLAIKNSPHSVPWRLGIDESVRGWSLHAHSTLPLGAQTTVKVRWGVNAHYDWMRGWESPLSSVKFPYLYLQKVSLLTTGSSIIPSSHGGISKYQLESLARDEEIHDLSPVAVLCGSAKRQLQLLYAENQVLKNSMEEMKSQVEQMSSVKSRNSEQRSSRKSRDFAGSFEDVLVEEQISSSKLPEHAPELQGSFMEKSIKSHHENSGTVADKTKRNHANGGLDALKKLGGLGRDIRNCSAVKLLQRFTDRAWSN